MSDFGIGWPEVMQILALAAYIGRDFLALWSLATAGVALFAVVVGLRDLTVRAGVSGMSAWVVALIGCFLQPGFLPPNQGFLFDRVTTAVILAAALPLWVLVCGLKLVRERRRG